MFFNVEVLTGPVAGRRFKVPYDAPFIFGRGIRSQFMIAEDGHLSGVHFSLEYIDNQCVVRDLGSTNGTFVNNVPVTRGTIVGLADIISAGNSTFRILPTAADDWSWLPPEKKAFLSTLYGAGEPVFVILDAARENRVPAFLEAYETENMSLYEGKEAEDLKDVAPYLAALPQTSKLINPLMNEGWGQSWGVFLTSQKSLADVRRHLRKFLHIRTEEGRSLYFRFYDPRILRLYFKTCNSDEEASFFGPVSRFVMQGEDPNIAVEFRRPDWGAKTWMKTPDRP